MPTTRHAQELATRALLLDADDALALSALLQDMDALATEEERHDFDHPIDLLRGALTAPDRAARAEKLAACASALAVWLDDDADKHALDRDMVGEFVDESRQHLRDGMRAVTTLAAGSRDPAALQTLFASFHTIMSVAALLGLAPIAYFAHAGETFATRLQRGVVPLDAETTFLARRGLRMLERCVDQVEAALLTHSAIAPPPSDLTALAAELEAAGEPQ